MLLPSGADVESPDGPFMDKLYTIACRAVVCSNWGPATVPIIDHLPGWKFKLLSPDRAL